MIEIKKFVESLKVLSGKGGVSDSELHEEMKLFFDSQRNFSELIKSLKENPHNGKDKKYFRNISFKLDEFLSGLRDFFIFLNELIFSAIDSLGENHSDFVCNLSEGSGFLDFYRRNFSSYRVTDNKTIIIKHIKFAMEYIVDHLDDDFLKKNLFHEIVFINFKNNYFNFIKAINVYFISHKLENFVYMEHSLRCVNIYMMSMINFIEDFCLAIGSLWLFL